MREEAKSVEVEPRPNPLLAGPWSMKSIYLLYYGAFAIYITFLSLYLKSLHLSGTEIGLLASLPPLAGVALQPVWGLLSDTYRWRKPLLVVALLVSAAMAPVVSLAHSFPALIFSITALSAAVSCVIPLSDATTLEWVSRHAVSFGAIRIYGSLGFLIGALLSGPALTIFGISALFPLFGCVLFVCALAAITAPPQGRATHTRSVGSIATILRNRGVVLFLILVSLAYASNAAYNAFLALYYRDLGASTSVIGLAAGLASLSELPVMALSGRLMRRLGVKPMLLIGFGAATFRWFGYGLIHDYRIALVFQLLHGLSFAASYVASVTYMDMHVPPELRSVGQTLFYGATFGLGAVLGTNLFGVLLDRVHTHGIFLIAGIMCGIAVAGIALFLSNTRVPEPAT